MAKTTFGLPKKREEVLNLLQQAYVDRNLEDDEYESRLTRAMQASSVEELQEIIEDFPNAPQLLPRQQAPQRPAGGSVATRPSTRIPAMPSMGVQRSSALLTTRVLYVSESISKHLRLSTFFGEHKVSLQHASVVGETLFISIESGLGSTVLDLRGEMLANKRIEINITNVLSEIKILLPKGVQVDNEIDAIMGDVKHSHKTVQKWLKKLVGGQKAIETRAIPCKVVLYGNCIMGEVKLIHD